MDLQAAFRPSVLLTEVLFPYQTRPSIFTDSVERIAEAGFYRSVEIREVRLPAERRRIAKAAREHDLLVSMWMSAFLIENGLSISSLDEEQRVKSVGLLKEQLDHAAECEASRFAMIPGVDPGPQQRKAAQEQLYISLCELCEAAQRYGSMGIVLEPLDRDFDKNGVVGPTQEFVALVDRIRASFANMHVNWDTAHVALCGDDVFASLVASRHVLNGIHLANAVLDRDDPAAGDRHMPIGEPGFLTLGLVADLFRKMQDICLDQDCPISVEVRSQEGQDPWMMERQGREVLCQAWSLVDQES